MTILISFIFSVFSKRKLDFINFHFVFSTLIIFPTAPPLFSCIPTCTPRFLPWFPAFPRRFPALALPPHSLHFHPSSLNSPHSASWFPIPVFADSPYRRLFRWIKYKKIVLGITTDRDLKLDHLVNNLCKKACQKLNALARLAPLMNFEKNRIVTMEVSLISQFRYCLLVSMLQCQSFNNKINRIQEGALRITYNDKS